MISPDEYNYIKDLADVSTAKRILESTRCTNEHRLPILKLLTEWQNDLFKDTETLIDETDDGCGIS